MTSFAAVAFALFHLEDTNLFTFLHSQNFRLDARALDDWCADFHGIAVGDEEDMIDFDRAGVRFRDFLSDDFVAFADAELFAAETDDCKFRQGRNKD